MNGHTVSAFIRYHCRIWTWLIRVVLFCRLRRAELNQEISLGHVLLISKWYIVRKMGEYSFEPLCGGINTADLLKEAHSREVVNAGVGGVPN